MADTHSESDLRYRLTDTDRKTLEFVQERFPEYVQLGSNLALHLWGRMEGADHYKSSRSRAGAAGVVASRLVKRKFMTRRAFGPNKTGREYRITALGEAVLSGVLG